MVVLSVGVAAYLIVRPEPVHNAGNVVGYTAPARTSGSTSAPTSTSTTPTKRVLNVVILRGGRSGCYTTGGCNATNYSAVLQYKLGWNVTVLQHGSTGYVAGNLQVPDVSFPARVAQAYPIKPDLLIVEGSVNDAKHPPSDVRDAARALFEKVKQNLPDTTVVSVGPIWGGSTPPAAIVATENAVKAASSGRVAKFIDPIAEHWFAGANATFMTKDHVSPSDQGHRLIAVFIARDLAALDLSGHS